MQAERRIILKDATLREGLDTPGVRFTLPQRIWIAGILCTAGVPEIEIVAPGRFDEDLEFAKRLKSEELSIRTSGLIYAYHPSVEEQMEKAGEHLDRFDILMPASPKRKPARPDEKIRMLTDAVGGAVHAGSDVGAGVPHALQVEEGIILDLCNEAIRRGAGRITVYDTNGAADPFTVREFVSRLRANCPVPLFFHAHNDLGLATANSLAAVLGGADGLDVTVNGLGDRAGNASLEQVAVALYLRGVETGVDLRNLKALCAAVEKESGVAVSWLAPIVGDYVFRHKSPGHLEHAELFEGFDPALVGADRKLPG